MGGYRRLTRTPVPLFQRKRFLALAVEFQRNAEPGGPNEFAWAGALPLEPAATEAIRTVPAEIHP